jgi:hypothetical protein
VAESIEQLSFSLTASELAEQERALSGLRTCAGTVLASASIAGSFLAVRIGKGSLDVLGVCATISFVLCLIGTVWVLMPHTFVFSFRGESLLLQSDREGPDLREAYRAAGIWMEPHVQANRRMIAMLAGWLTASCVLLALEVVLWTLSAGG